jgi:hypothetical protein
MGRALEAAAGELRLNSDIESLKSRRPRDAISHSESGQGEKRSIVDRRAA